MTCDHSKTCEHCARIEGERDGFKISIAFLHEREREYQASIMALLNERDRLLGHLEAYTKAAHQATQVIRELIAENAALYSAVACCNDNERIEA